MEITLRRATIEDIPSILEVEKGVVGTKVYSGLTGAEDATQEINENVYFVIEKDGKGVGDVSYQIQGEDKAYVNGLAVAVEFQRQGIARQAMKMMLEMLKDYKTVYLMTHPENIRAINLYESLGFKKTGEIYENYYNDGEPRIKMILEK